MCVIFTTQCSMLRQFYPSATQHCVEMTKYFIRRVYL